MNRPTLDALAVLARFLLELGHAVEPAHARGAAEASRPARHGPGRALWANRIERFGVDPAGDQRRGHFADVGAKLRGVDVDRQRVEVGEEEQALRLVLHPHPAQDRAEQIAEVQIAGRLNARNDAHRGWPSSSVPSSACRLAERLAVDAADQPGDAEIDEAAGADQRSQAEQRARARRAGEVAAEQLTRMQKSAAAIASAAIKLARDAADEPAGQAEMAALA